MTVVTISREFGSGGTEIAARVCSLLGYTYFDKQYIIRAATQAGLTEQDALDFREESSQARTFVEQLLMPGPPLTAEMAVRGEEHALSVALLDSDRCLTLVQAAIHATYKNGNAVIVGRGGQAVLQRLPGVLHVLVQAPMPARILRIQEMEKVDLETAYQMAVQHDKKTMRYLERVFGIKWDDPLLYHLVINTGKWDLEAAAQLIVYAARQVQA